jgi:hypothetical protein
MLGAVSMPNRRRSVDVRRREEEHAVTRERVEVLRAMTHERKLEVASPLYREALELKAAGLRGQHPEWDGQRVRDEVRRIFLRART